VTLKNNSWGFVLQAYYGYVEDDCIWSKKTAISTNDNSTDSSVIQCTVVIMIIVIITKIILYDKITTSIKEVYNTSRFLIVRASPCDRLISNLVESVNGVKAIFGSAVIHKLQTMCDNNLSVTGDSVNRFLQQLDN